MTLLQGIQTICSEAIPAWKLYFEDRPLMNAKADNVAFPLIFFEEYREGSYTFKYFLENSTRVQLYFCKLCQLQNDGLERERLREEIERDAVLPFIDALSSHPEVFQSVEKFSFFTPPPRFDANEVSIMLQFNAVLTDCL